MQVLLVLGRLLFLALIYIFLFRMLTALLGGLQMKGLSARRGERELGQLEVLIGGDALPKGKIFRLGRRELRVGRGKNNDIALTDHFASVDHAVFKLYKGVPVVEDLGSTNGTWVNGERISSAVQLVPGDYVKIGSITFQYSRWQNESS